MSPPLAAFTNRYHSRLSHFAHAEGELSDPPSTATTWLVSTPPRPKHSYSQPIAGGAIESDLALALFLFLFLVHSSNQSDLCSGCLLSKQVDFCYEASLQATGDL